MTGRVEGHRRWFLNRQRQTMVVIPAPGAISMGRGKDQRQCLIDRQFAIASHEVTVGEFLRFRKHHQYLKQFSPTDDCPMIWVNWFDAVAYCNWLSDQEGLPKDQWCYEPNDEGRYEDGAKMAPNFLSREGYRLPTEAEWEYACRADTDTDYSFGDSDDLLRKYAWFVGDSLSKSHPVGSLQGNDLGLFDMNGNVWEWCQDAFGVYDDRAARKDHVENLLMSNDADRVLRGGSFNDQPIYLCSYGKSRKRATPDFGETLEGFRIAKTCPMGNPHVPATNPPGSNPGEEK
jgi:formylglycine-generating enzyme required for sulfatase activity